MCQSFSAGSSRWKGRCGGRHTINSRKQDSGVVVGNDVGISVLWFVDLQVRVLPRELLTRIDGLWSRGTFVNLLGGWVQYDSWVSTLRSRLNIISWPSACRAAGVLLEHQPAGAPRLQPLHGNKLEVIGSEGRNCSLTDSWFRRSPVWIFLVNLNRIWLSMLLSVWHLVEKRGWKFDFIMDMWLFRATWQCVVLGMKLLPYRWLHLLKKTLHFELVTKEQLVFRRLSSWIF